jgi:hypothetical protein
VEYRKATAARQINISYLDSARSKEFWNETEVAYKPLVEQFRKR